MLDNGEVSCSYGDPAGASTSVVSGSGASCGIDASEFLASKHCRRQICYLRRASICLVLPYPFDRLEDAEEKTKSLNNVIHGFAEMAIAGKLQIRCFYETRRTQFPQPVVNGWISSRFSKVKVCYSIVSACHIY